MGDLLGKLLDAVKGLTLTNVAIIALLALVAVPAYTGWKVINDPVLMGIVFSSYREIKSPTECNLIYAQPAGGTGFFAITNPFAERNAEWWSVGVRIKFEPDDEAMKKYCTALGDVIDFARDPVSAPAPTFPGSTRELFPGAHALVEYHVGTKDDGRPKSLGP